MALLRPKEIATIAGLTEPSLAICDHRIADDLAARRARADHHLLRRRRAG